MKKTVLALLAALFMCTSAFASVSSEWAVESIYLAEQLGIIADIEDFGDYTRPITREEICVMAIYTYESITGSEVEPGWANPFADEVDPLVIAAANMGLVNGRSDIFFDGHGGITREEAAKLFVVLAQKLGIEPDGTAEAFYDIYDVADWAQWYVNRASAYGFMTANYQGLFLPKEELTVEQAAAAFTRLYMNAWSGMGASVQTISTSVYTGTGTYVYDGKYKKNDPNTVFTEGPITTKEQADSQMVQITVDIWELKNGEKVPGTMNLTVHKNIAEVTKEVFAEIFNGSEKFPIDKSGTYGYSFRNTAGTSRLSEHATGTAIDINPNQNYCVYSNGSTVGSFYLPGENPYSIQKFGDCWNAFVSHGFTWGGDAWSSPQDYMHFSYLGK